ncbi:MAG: hypothetical protein IJ128_00275 [Firmicutes bacterium]|nr:hypothetical protein [Bacillota bacterium]
MRQDHSKGFGDRTNPHRYDDIIDLQRPRTGRHKPMDSAARAAQFAPFAALTGYEEVIEQTARKNEADFEKK